MGVEKALAESETMLGTSLAELATDKDTGEITPILTLVIDNGGSFRAFKFEKFMLGHPECDFVR